MSLSKIRAYNQILSQSITPAELSSSIAGTGLTGGAGSALSVVYGSGSGQAAQGNTSLSSRGTARQITVASDAAWEALTGTTAAVTADGVLEFVVDCDGTAGNLFVDTFSATVA